MTAVCDMCGRNTPSESARIRGLCHNCDQRTESQRVRVRMADNDTNRYRDKEEDFWIARDKRGAIRSNIPRLMYMHSPAGYGWGNDGVGQLDLSLNILLQVCSFKMAKALHVDFSREFLMQDTDEITIPHGVVVDYIEHKKKWYTDGEEGTGTLDF